MSIWRSLILQVLIKVTLYDSSVFLKKKQQKENEGGGRFPIFLLYSVLSVIFDFLF